MLQAVISLKMRWRKKVGAETVGYLSNICKYYLVWKLMTERETARAKVKEFYSELA
jgi:hypothetical protein